MNFQLSHRREAYITIGVRRSRKRPRMKSISIVTPCYNEEDNVREVVRRTREVMKALPLYDYEHIFIDNSSKDSTVAILREMAAEDRRIKVIVNARNFGHLRSPVHAMYQASGDVIFVL